VASRTSLFEADEVDGEKDSDSETEYGEEKKKPVVM
jgi:hypothetical protein